MRPLIVDSFAGGGGASTGIEMALGRSPDIAINHDADALAMHEVNHPETLHLSKNIWKVDPLEAVGYRPVGLAWFSPDCKHFSKAKGGRPVKRNIRDLAWVVVLWAKRVRPAVIMLENVEEFRDWGPLIEREPGTWVPCPERKGAIFKKWTSELRRLGYKLEFRELRACDYGAPTIRKRFFMIARRDGLPIVWPDPTHGPPDDPDVIAGKKKPWRTAAEIIDWSIPCPSIFDSSETIKQLFGVRAIRPLADATMRRIARGVVRYVLEAKRPFIVRTDMASAASRNGVNPIDDPLRTQTTAGSHAVVVPSFVGCGGRAGQSAPRCGDEPLGTMTAKPDGCVVTAHLTYGQQGGGNRPVDAPHHTITASSKDQNAVVAATMVQTGYGEREGQVPRALDIGKPLGTQVAGGAKHGVVAAFLAQHNNDSRRIGGVNPGRPAGEPLATLTASGAQQQVVSAFMSRQFSASIGHALREPAATDTAGVNKSALIAPFLTKYYGTGDGARVDGPMHTDTVKDRMGLVTVEIDGATYAIADIGMRMLTPRERFRAQGFPDDYVIDRRIDGSPITGTAQGSCCGNSVCPPLAAALVGANCAHLAEAREAAE
ncbi:DNA cytosine methyltransferase [Pararhizobium haloflavum]|uniref:DNA cytosine methyltransferase n=1 Tax=Pararhizobium haloflavum TaxID=2037914 RepID=UPI000C17D7B9|nr:DNA cytosine methyltransferase [Pararhizobium haloflavum]